MSRMLGQGRVESMKKKIMTSPKKYLFERWSVTQEGNDIIASAENNHGYVVLVAENVIAPESCVNEVNGHRTINLERLLEVFPDMQWEETRNVWYDD
jgi:hypothetical protein